MSLNLKESSGPVRSIIANKFNCHHICSATQQPIYKKGKLEYVSLLV